MNTAIWIVQILLAVAFGGAGFQKVIKPYAALKEQMRWVEDFSPGIIRIIGGLEVLGAVGLILPTLTGVLPWLTPIAAIGLVLTMVGASATHVRRGEYQGVVVNVILLAMAAFVVYGRMVSVPV